MLNQKIEDAFNWRYACKKYDATKQISAADWQTLQDSLVKAPSSYGLQPWKVLVVENKDTREKLRKVSWDQAQVTDCSKFVVFITKDSLNEEYAQNYMQSIANTRGVATESLDGYKGMIVSNVVKGMTDEQLLSWSKRQAYIGMGFLLETAALLNIDSTPMEGLDPAEYDKMLGLEGTGYKTVCAVALGYRHKEDGYQHAKKVRIPKEEFIKVL
jgi:nitroreductase